MVIVKKQKGESEDRLIARFKKEVLEPGILEEVRDRQRHKTEPEKRKEKRSRVKHSIELEKNRNY